MLGADTAAPQAGRGEEELPIEIEEDPIVEACLRDALSPYESALSPEQLADYRRLLIVFIKTHPAAAPLYERLRERPAVLAASGVVARDGDTAAEGAAPCDGTFGKPR
jgi:hypothetical protein